MTPFLGKFQREAALATTRRQFFGRCATGIGSLALASLLNERAFAARTPIAADRPLAPKGPHFTPRARRAIYIHMAGMNEERNGSKLLGRDHHPHCFSLWMAGGGIQRGITYGETDELGYHVAKDKVHVHDLQATILHCFGLDHTKLTYKFQGRDFRLTDVFGEVVHGILA